MTDEWDKVELHMYVKKYLRLLTYAIIPLLLFMERGWSQSHLTSILTFIVVKTYALVYSGYWLQASIPIRLNHVLRSIGYDIPVDSLSPVIYSVRKWITLP